MRGWLIYTKKDAVRNMSYIEWFIKEANYQQVELILVYREDLQIGITKGKPTVLHDFQRPSLPDFVVVRTIEPLVQQTFEALDVPTFNSSKVASLVNHKSWTYNEMNRLGIPILPTFFATKDALPTEPPLAYPFVVKEATGRGGKEVYFVENEKEWKNVQSSLVATDIILQDTNVQLGKDLRVFVIGKDIVAAVLRKNEKDFRANFTLGGSAQLYYLSAEERRMIEKIIDHFDFGLVGIDFLLSKDGSLIFNEIEDVVGSRILSATTDINLLERYVSFIKQKLEAGSS